MSGHADAISWNDNFEQVMNTARTEGRDVLLDFSAAPM